MKTSRGRRTTVRTRMHDAAPLAWARATAFGIVSGGIGILGHDYLDQSRAHVGVLLIAIACATLVARPLAVLRIGPRTMFIGLVLLQAAIHVTSVVVVDSSNPATSQHMAMDMSGGSLPLQHHAASTTMGTVVAMVALHLVVTALGAAVLLTLEAHAWDLVRDVVTRLMRGTTPHIVLRALLTPAPSSLRTPTVPWFTNGTRLDRGPPARRVHSRRLHHPEGNHMKLRYALTTAAAALFIAVPAATAHISVKSDNTSAGGYAFATFVVPHGCEGSPTTKIELQVPDGVTSFVPERSSFYDVKVTTKKPSEAMDNGHGEAITEVPDVVTWTATTPLPDGQLDALGASMKLPDEEGQINFPLVQTCEKGSTSWNEIQKEGAEEPEHPAPSLMLTAASGDEHGSDDAMSDDDKASTSSDHNDKEIGDLQDDVDQARTTAIIGIVVGAIGLLFGLVAMRRRKP